MAIVNCDSLTIVTTSKDSVRDLVTALAGIANIDAIKIVVATDAQLRDAIARVLWPDKKGKRT